MATQIDLGEITVEVVHKDIKNLHLSVYPPVGRVRVTAPAHMGLDTIRIFLISKLAWIKQQQRKLHEQQREPPRDYIDRESHYLWGRRYLLSIQEHNHAPGVKIAHNRLVLQVRAESGRATREEVLARWYRDQVRAVVPGLIAKWQAVLGVQVEHYFVQLMKTKWGSCNPVARTIRLNTELAKKPRECLEYIVVHEMVHLLESRHNDRFIALMDAYLPLWREYRDILNRAPLGHVDWTY